ncbi:MAG: hypothetical protein ACR2N3_00330 [Pyrinomonadaceae bacterium]
MKTISQVTEVRESLTKNSGFAVETTFVLFFLAVEFGQSFRSLSLDNICLAITLAAVAVLPFFLPSEDKPSFGNWLFGRSLIAGFAILLGVMFKQSLGAVLPEMFRFLPMTLLIITAMLSCYIQFYGLLKIRLAK